MQVVHIGGVIDEATADEARAEAARNPRYTWVGEFHRDEARRRLQRCRLMVISSREEGGANVVGEAIVDGVPILASHIDGNVGLLGDDYPGYFPVGDDEQLARLLRRAETDAGFYAALQAACEARRPLFDRAAEQQALADLLAELELVPANTR